MPVLTPFQFSTKKAISEATSFISFMKANPGPLDERKHLEPAMDNSLNMMAAHFWNPRTFCPDSFGIRKDIDSRFRFDYAFGDSKSGRLALIEIEDAKPSAIFNQRSPRRDNDWGRAAEHGFSQIIDWIYAIKEVMSQQQHQRDFGFNISRIHALLIIGRDDYLTDRTEQNRLEWRSNHVTAYNANMDVATFDGFAQNIHDSLTAQPFKAS